MCYHGFKRKQYRSQARQLKPTKPLPELLVNFGCVLLTQCAALLDSSFRALRCMRNGHAQIACKRVLGIILLKQKNME
jgi:hypothetical protein